MTDTPATQHAEPPADPRRIGFREFVALMAMLFSTIAFSIDAMLPALPRIGAELAPDALSQVQLVVTVFVLGMGLGTLICGPLSDALGRKSVLVWGLGLFVLGALAGARAETIEGLLAARFVQGLGAAAPRVVALAMVRDLYEGRTMARVMSIVMTLFIFVPAVAPSIGAAIIWAFDWRAIFLAFVVFGLVSSLWLGLRQPETLPPEARRPLRPALLAAALVEILGNPAVRLYTLVMACAFGSMFTWLSGASLIFADVFDREASFPFWFAGLALVAGSSNLLNARLVMHLGMRRIATTTFAVQAAVALPVAGLVVLGLPAPWDFALVLGFLAMVFFSLGLTMGNLNALAMQPLGHMAGIGAAVIGFLQTVLAVAIAVPLSLAYDGTPLPAVLGTAGCATAALVLMLRAARHDHGPG